MYDCTLHDFKWSDLVSATQMETSCDRKSPKLSSVDQKVFMIVIWLYVEFYDNVLDGKVTWHQK